MKDNTNPIYLQEFFTTSIGANPNDFVNNVDDPNSLLTKGAVGAVGLASKILKDNRIVSRIISEFPDPMQLKEYLLTTLKSSSEATLLASKLTPNMSMKDYRSYLRKYICKGNLFRYFIHTLGGTYSLAGNALGAGMNEFTPAKELINYSLS